MPPQGLKVNDQLCIDVVLVEEQGRWLVAHSSPPQTWVCEQGIRLRAGVKTDVIGTQALQC